AVREGFDAVSPANREVVAAGLEELERRVVTAVREPATPKDRTFLHQLQRWLEEKRTELRPKAYNNICSISRRWADLPFVPTDVADIDAEAVRSFRLWVKTATTNEGGRLSDSQQRQHGLYFRAFVKWLWKM